MPTEAALTIETCLKLSPRPKIVFMPTLRQGFDGSSVGNNVITLDPRVSVIRTLLHELIHVARPLWSERRVILEERRLWKLATWQDKAELYKMLGRAHIWTGEGTVPELIEETVND